MLIRLCAPFLWPQIPWSDQGQIKWLEFGNEIVCGLQEDDWIWALKEQVYYLFSAIDKFHLESKINVKTTLTLFTNNHFIQFSVSFSLNFSLLDNVICFNLKRDFLFCKSVSKRSGPRTGHSKHTEAVHSLDIILHGWLQLWSLERLGKSCHLDFTVKIT
jgi:hypothetical protein